MSLDLIPRVHVTVTGSNATFPTPHGYSEPLAAALDEDIRRKTLVRTAAEAQRAGNSVELITSGDGGDHHLVVGTDGTIAPSPATRRERIQPSNPREEVSEQVPGHDPSGRAPEPHARASFINAPVAEHRTNGWRAALACLGISVDPSPAEVARARDERSVSLEWAGCRTIAVVKRKGGVGKTMTTAMIAAMFGRHGGRVPFDPALKSGPLRLDNLRAATGAALLRVTAAVARGL